MYVLNMYICLCMHYIISIYNKIQKEFKMKHKSVYKRKNSCMLKGTLRPLLAEL